MSSEGSNNLIEAIYPLSPIQQGMLFYSVARSETAQDMYAVQWSCTLPETLAIVPFERAWQRVIERHPILRTAFLWQDLDEPLQVVGRHVSIHVQSLDWSELLPEQFEVKKEAWLQADQAQGFALAAAPLMRLTLLRQPDRAYRFIWSYHHLLLDGWSWPLVLQEVFTLYAAFRQDQELSLPEVRPFQDYIAWLQQQDLGEAEAFWRQSLRGFTEATPLGIDRAGYRDHGTAPAFHSLDVRFSESETSALSAFARQQKITLNTLMQGAWALLLSYYSGKNDVVFGTVVSGRPFDMDGVDAMIGVFINTLPVRVLLAANQTCQAWLRELQWQQLEARQYEYSPLVQVQKWSDVAPGQPLFESLLVYENYPMDVSVREHGRNLQVRDIAYEGRSNYPLTLIIDAGNQRELLFRLVYDAQRFDAQTIQQLGSHFQQMLRCMVAKPQQLLGTISPLLAEERTFLLETLNQTAQPVMFQTLHALFEAQVERTPETWAAVFAEERVTYRELNRRANWFAHRLRALGVGPDVLVGLYVERSIDMVVGLLGILKAGGAYVPIDAIYPQERVAYILADTNVSLILTQQALLERLPEGHAQALCLDIPWEHVPAELANPVHTVTPEHLAYIIYTSGSTGKPKGVMVPHRGVANIVLTKETRPVSLAPERELGPGKRTLQFTSLCFDASVWEIMPTLTSGATLYLGSRETLQPGPSLIRFFQEQAITNTFLTPAVLAALHAEHDLPTLERVVAGGEACSLDIVRRWGREKSFYNIYGPTETTIYSTTTLCEANLEQTPPIGRPIANTQIYLLNEKLGLVRPGGAGEIYIGGAGVTRGYLRRPDLTAERFVPHPFSQVPGARLYKTGDLARYLPDGQLEYLGRNDQQVKIRGFRIELGEIDATLTQHPALHDAVTVVRDEGGMKHLVAYLLAPKGAVSVAQLRAFLAERLPEYLIPAMFVFLDAFPLNTNGKVDRQALPAPNWEERYDSTSAYALPQTPTEELLVGIWSRVLGQKQIGVQDNFFELGGDSIISLQIVAGAAQVGLQITPRQLFQYPTIAELALAAQAGNEHTTPHSPIETVVQGPLPLTPIQHWFVEQTWENPHHFNQAQLWSVPGNVDAACLEKALQHLLRHHDALRMRFQLLADGQWQQENRGEMEETVAFVQYDLSGLQPDEQARMLQDEASQLHTRLHLGHGPLFQAALFHYGDQQPGRLLIVVHHLVIDMVSWRILLEDLETSYAQLLRGEEVHLPPKTASFKQWAEQLVVYAQQPEVRAELAYWQKSAQCADVSLPRDKPHGQNTVAETDIVEVVLEKAATQALLQTVPTVYHTQMNDALLLALVQAVATWTGQRSVLIDLEGHGREDIGAGLDVSRTIGWFTTIFPVALQLPETSSPGRALMQMKEQLRAIPQRGIGYGILRYLSVSGQAELRSLPPAEISFNYLGQFGGSGQDTRRTHFLPASEFSGVPHSPQAPRAHVLDVTGYVQNGCLRITCEYSEQLHQRQTIEDFAHGYLHALYEIVEHAQTATTCRYTPSDFPLVKLTQEQLEEVSKGREIENLYPLSPLQQGLLFHSLYTPHAGAYIVQQVMKFTGTLDIPSFLQAWQDVIAHHAILRTAFVWEHVDEPVQVVHRAGSLPLQELDWSEVPASEQRERLDHLLQTTCRQDFDLTQAPLLRFFLIDLGQETWYFVENFHHILLDGWSLALVQQEFFKIYLAYSQQDSFSLDPVKPYSDYIAWLAQQDRSKAQQFWQKELAGITAPTALPFEQLSQEVLPDEAGYARQSLALSPAFSTQLQGLARQLQVTLNTLFQGAWAFLLSRYSGERDVLYGTTLAGRPTVLPGSERMVGLFINTLPRRVHVPDQTLAADWLKMLHAQQAELQQYEYCPLMDVQEWSEIPRGVPLFHSLFVFENYQAEHTEMSASTQGLLSAEQICSVEQTHYPLTVGVEPGETLTLQVLYECRRFGPESIARLLGHMSTILTSFVAQPYQPLASMNYLSLAEMETLTRKYNQTTTHYPRTQTIHQTFVQQALAYPTYPAVEYGEIALTYADLNEQANRLAHYLRMRGAGPGTCIAVYVERSLDTIVALLGILKAGGICVPLDLSYPLERLTFMLEDTEAPLLLSHASLQTHLPHYQGQWVCLDTDWPVIAQCSACDPENLVTAEDPAYLFYTSGSTGVPKGVCLPHRSILRLVCNTNYTTFGVGERVAQIANTSFDAALLEIWGALLNGGCLIGISREVSLSPLDLADYAQRKQISLIGVTTALLHQIARTVPTALQTVRTVLFGGEAGDPRWINLLVEHGTAAQRYVNVYGPTESTTCATWYEVTGKEEHTPTIPIGSPLANTTCYILDAYLHPVPIGVPGELYIGGDGLAQAYWKRPELTAERFVPSPWGTKPGERVYRTGDLAYMQENGTIVFLGRLDSQVKLRGFRIELGEIETALRQHSSVSDAIAFLREDEPGEKRLVAYVLVKEPQHVIEQKVLQHMLAERLPAHMVPSAIVQVDTWPLTPNGKVDYARLPLPSLVSSSDPTTFVAPRNATERQLAAIWEQLLHIQAISVTDEFFTLGGNSLLAIRLVAQIQQCFGQTLALPVLFQHGTVEKLAAIIEQQAKPAPLSPLVAIQPHGSRPPLFCVHPGSGNVFQYYELARQLGDDQPLYAFQDTTVHAEHFEATDLSIERMASCYLHELLQVQPVGPYYLGGYSLGGVIAFEMACKLTQMGHKVALLTIFDGGTPKVAERSRVDEVMLLAIISLELLRTTAWTLETLYTALNVLEPQTRFTFVLDQLQQAGYTLTDAHMAMLQRQLQVFQCREQALRSYKPPVYEGRVILMRSSELDTTVDDDLAYDLGWGELTTLPLEIHQVPGHHDTMFLQPHIRYLARCVQDCLQQALPSSPEREVVGIR